MTDRRIRQPTSGQNHSRVALLVAAKRIKRAKPGRMVVRVLRPVARDRRQAERVVRRAHWRQLRMERLVRGMCEFSCVFYSVLIVVLVFAAELLFAVTFLCRLSLETLRFTTFMSTNFMSTVNLFHLQSNPQTNYHSKFPGCQRKYQWHCHPSRM